MDIEALRFRAGLISRIRAFFAGRGYLELDTPALAPALIPEACLEVFRADYVPPGDGAPRPLYLVPSPEVFMKRVIAEHRVNVFQVSRCWRNAESQGRWHSPEFTMLEYYTMGADYRASASLTEDFFAALRLPPALRPPFTRITMDEAFLRWAGFRLSEAPEPEALAARARRLGIAESAENPFGGWAWDALYELIFVHAVEPRLPRGKPVILMDYPARQPCLAKNAPGGFWKERWELYGEGVELANCYSEETDAAEVRAYFEREGAAKARSALVPHALDADYWRFFQGFPECSGAALGVDRLAALASGRRSLEGMLPFPLEAAL